MATKKIFTIGIAGGTSSGKTSICKYILQECENVAYISLDSCYKSMPGNIKANDYNFDHPNAFDWDLAVQILTKLQLGEAVHVPEYDFINHQRTTKTTLVQPAKVILFEGILALHDPVLRELLDLKVYIDCDDDLRLIRRIIRDMAERGRNLKGIMQQYVTTVKKSHDNFVEPSKREADIIITRGKENTIGISTLIAKIKEHV